MANILKQRYNEVESGNQAVKGNLAGLKTKRADLKDKLKSCFRAILPGANRESSTWLALSAEYGPNEPITQILNSDLMLVQMRNHVDH